MVITNGVKYWTPHLTVMRVRPCGPHLMECGAKGASFYFHEVSISSVRDRHKGFHTKRYSFRAQTLFIPHWLDSPNT